MPTTTQAGKAAGKTANSDKLNPLFCNRVKSRFLIGSWQLIPELCFYANISSKVSLISQAILLC